MSLADTRTEHEPWAFDVPGQPPSVNHLYTPVRGHWNKRAKAQGVEQYQRDVALLCRTARPSGWEPHGYLRIGFEFHLKRDADCDNLIKAIQDAIAHAIGCNDKLFLPCVIRKTTGNSQPHTKVTIAHAQ